MNDHSEELTIGIVDEPNPGDEDDKLGIERHANALTEFIKSTSTPMTIGIQGEWGSGKTSLLNSIHHALEENGNFKQIWINSWEHSLLTTPSEALLKIINEIIQEMLKSDKYLKSSDKITKIAQNVFKGALRIGATAVGGSEAGAVTKELLGENSNTIKELRKHLDKLANEIKKSNKCNKIIIYVDDLDRIEPKDAVNILELLKNIFNIPNCVFVLAIDYQVVVKGLEHKFGKRSDENEWEFRAFFDKIIQLPFMMPMSQYSIGKYVNDLLQQINFIDSEDLFEEEIEEVISYTIGGNPRSLKRLVNSLALINIFSNLDKEIEEDEEQENEKETNDRINHIDQKIEDTKDLSLFALVCLQISFPKIYDLLVQYPDFKLWDDDIAFKVTEKKEEENKKKFDEEFSIVKKTEEFDDKWEQALFRICFTSPRYRSRVSDISKFFNYLNDKILNSLENKERGSFISDIIDKTSVTSVTSTDESQNRASKPYQKLITDNADEGWESYFRDKWNKNKFSKIRELVKYIDSDLTNQFSNKYRFQYSPSAGSTFFSSNGKIGEIQIYKGGMQVSIRMYRHPKLPKVNGKDNDFRKPIVNPLVTENCHPVTYYWGVDWYKLLISNIQEYEETKSKIYELIVHSEDALVHIKTMKKKLKRYPLKFDKTSAYNKNTGNWRNKNFKRYVSDNWTYVV